MKHVLMTACAALALMACSPESDKSKDTAAPAAITPVKTDLPAGAYKLDKFHASLTFRVSHLGFSNYTARFKRFDAQLQLDPTNPTAAQLTATVDASSLETDFPDPAMVDFNAQLRGKEWLDTAQFPEMAYRSTSITLTGPNTARIDGDLTLHGATRPVALAATFNGGYPGFAPLDPQARIGFSATGTLKRSEFGIAAGIPEPGSNIGVSDAVEVILEAEFLGPPLAAQPPKP